MSKLKKKAYHRALKVMQRKLVGLERWVEATGARVVVLFEGRDSAGKGGTIGAIQQHLNPRHVRVVALTKPDEREAREWYFQRYLQHLPSKGEIVLFDRSWYNRAGVEQVMGFATPAEVEAFLETAPKLEKMLVEDGILLFKYWLTCDQDKQEERFEERREDPLKGWKLSPIDVVARDKYDDYGAAREAMLRATHTKWAPWTLVDFNDQRRGRLTLIRDLLDRCKECKVDEAVADLPPLKGEPGKEHFSVIEPLPDFDPEP